MDRRRLWTYKGRSLKNYQQQYNFLYAENERLKKEREMRKKAIQCRENAELLAATAIIELETNEKVKSLVRTDMIPCEGCNECNGKLECYTLAIQK